MSSLCEGHRKRSVSERPGTSGLVFVVCAFAEGSMCCGFISLAYPAPASSGSPEPTIRGDSQVLQGRLPVQGAVGGARSSGSQLLELKIPQR